MATYPTATVSFSTKVDGVDLVQAAHVNAIQSEVVAIETQLITSKLASLATAPSGNQVLTSVAGAPTWAAPDGWTPATGVWTKGTGQTINVPSGAAAIYSVGNQIKLTDTTVKYFYVIAVADALLTVLGDTLVATPTTGTCYYSRIAMPTGFPLVFNYTPTITSQSGSGFTTTTTCKYSLMAMKLIFLAEVWVTAVGTATGFLRFTLPPGLLSPYGHVLLGFDAYGTSKKLAGHGLANSSTVEIMALDNTSPWVLNARNNMSGIILVGT